VSAVVSELLELYDNVEVEIWAPAFIWLTSVIQQLPEKLIYRSFNRPEVVEDILVLEPTVQLGVTAALKAFIKLSNTNKTAYDLLFHLCEKEAFSPEIADHIKTLCKLSQ
jgi:hypothetical protein